MVLSLFGHGVLHHQRDEVRAQDPQDAAERRADQFLQADLPDAELEHHDASRPPARLPRRYRAVKIERMKEKRRAGQNGDKKKSG